MKIIIIMFIYLIYSFLKIIYTYMKFFYNLCYVKRLLFVLLISTIIIIYTKKPNTYKIEVKTKQHIEVGKILAIRNQ